VVERLQVADQPDDGAHDALADERLTTYALDLLDDVGDVLGGGIGGHNDDHGIPRFLVWTPAAART